MPFVPDPSASGAEAPPAQASGGFTPDAQPAGQAAPSGPAGQIPGQTPATQAMVPPAQESEPMPDWLKGMLDSFAKRDGDLVGRKRRTRWLLRLRRGGTGRERGEGDSNSGRTYGHTSLHRSAGCCPCRWRDD